MATTGDILDDLLPSSGTLVAADGAATASSSMANSSAGDQTSVRVALRIRPQNARETLELCRVCTHVTPDEPQVTIGGDRCFTFDHVFDRPTPQTSVYERCVERLVEGIFDGYNATVLAYGQTGSGKTYTMGTAFDTTGSVIADEIGIIPRAMSHVFAGIDARRRDAKEEGRVEPVFDVQVQFIELYNEDIVDLLANERSAIAGGLRIHEDASGQIYLQGVTTVGVKSPQETLQMLKNGALGRTTARTNMNEQSSRSHAIFTLQIRQQRILNFESTVTGQLPGGNVSPDSGLAQSMPEYEVLTAKFHFVDLAGSERLKRTGATGDRAKEGISINCGLLALGNVISALGGAQGKVSHVPYRDSKLTRLLQDSLGGNSRTLMIACVSPSDCDFVETLNTLKYANRAKNIKNKVIANQDKTSKVISELRAEITRLQCELNEYRQGKRLVNDDGSESFNDQYHENVMLQAELSQLRMRMKSLQETSEMLRARNVQLLAERDARALSNGGYVNGTGINGDGGEKSEIMGDPLAETIRKYLEEIESMRASLYESQATSEQLRRQITRMKSQGSTFPNGCATMLMSPNNVIASTSMSESSMSTSMNTASGFSPEQLIRQARSEIERLRQLVPTRSGEVTNDYASTQDAMEDDAMSSESDRRSEIGDRDNDDESDEEMDKECVRLRDDLADLQTEISIKERLVEELERSERRLMEVRIMYERKLAELSMRITATEAERDRVLCEMAAKDPTKAAEEQSRKIRDEYERKLNEMRNEFRKLQSVEREHKRMQAKQAAEQQQLVKMQAELNEMKKIKVQLMQKIRDETKRAKAHETATAKHLATLEKETRKKDSQIKQLESKDRQRELFMQRNAEELNRLRAKSRSQQKSATSRGATTNGVRPRSAAINPRATVTAGGNRIASNANANANAAQRHVERLFSPRIAKAKWSRLEKSMCRLVTQKQTVMKMEEELNRLVLERHRLNDETAHLERRFVDAHGDFAERDALVEQIEGCRAKMTYLQEQITDAQRAIVDVDEEAKESTGSDEGESGAAPSRTTVEGLEAMLDECAHLPEAKYLLKHLFNFCLEQGVTAAKAIADCKETKARLAQLEQESRVHEQLLSQVIENRDIVGDLAAVIEQQQIKWREKKLVRSPERQLQSSSMTSSTSMGDKARRRTATPDELLYPLKTSKSLEDVRESRDEEDDDTIGQVPEGKRTRPTTPTQRVTSAGEMVEEDEENSEGSLHPSALPQMQTAFARNALLRSTIASASVVPGASAFTAWRARRQRQEENGKVAVNGNGKQGRIYRIPPRPLSSRRDSIPRLLSRTHTLDGHSKAVLSVAVDDRHIITGSKDRLAKLWDLTRGVEKCTLGLHANNVNVVRLIPCSELAFTVSMSQIRVWDLRTEKCVHTLNSSGIDCEGDQTPTVTSRQNTVPITETMITAAETDPTGKLLFSAFAGMSGMDMGKLDCPRLAGDVRVWNLEKFAAYGRLTAASHSPRSEVSCIASMTGPSCPTVFTGSRDHYVKMYRVPANGAGVFDATVEILPPHYDNVTCLQPYGDSLFTASKDTNIMKFSLRDYKRDHLELKAHGKWILGMCLLPLTPDPLLVSACKEGTIKLWDITSSRRFKLVEEIAQAHPDAINAVATNSDLLFTASNDATVGFWKPIVVL